MNGLPRVIRSVEEMMEWRRSITQKVGFVPTMGALHEGHATLLREVRKKSDFAVLSIFVNPTQFGPKEDFGNYPRTFERDLALAAREGIDVVFAPDHSEIYPTGFSTYVEEMTVSQPLCGVSRPGHFRGVTTVVLKLFNIVRPQIALFGLKDAQQFLVLQKMVRDLHVDVQVEGVPTVRESDGLAMSSRNVYLSPEERSYAPLIYQTLQEIKTQLENSGLHQNSDEMLSTARQKLENQGFKVQYLECLELPELKLATQSSRNLLVAVAAYLGKTRLIDNVMINVWPI